MPFPLVFVFQGKKLPKYIEYSLILNTIFSRSEKIYFISNVFPRRKIQGVIEVNLAGFYKPTIINFFTEEKKNIWWDGFWNKTIERFFIIEAFMKEYKYGSLVHMEIDNIGFDLLETIDEIKKMNEGLYYPTYKNNISAASILFIIGLSSIENFNSFILNNIDKTDMQLLYDYRNTKNNFAHDLPVDLSGNTLDRFGIFDLSYLGQFLFGIDKKILKSPNKNLYMSNQNFNDILTSDWHFLLENQTLLLVNESRSIKINNLHVHSKIHKKLLKQKYFLYLISRANRRKSVIIEFNLYYIIINRFISLILDVRKFFDRLFTKKF